MLKKDDKIFKNIYNEFGWDINQSIKREDWKDTKLILSKSVIFHILIVIPEVSSVVIKCVPESLSHAL